MPFQRHAAQPEPSDQLHKHRPLRHAVPLAQQHQAGPPQRLPDGGIRVPVHLEPQRRGIEGLHRRGQRLDGVDPRHSVSIPPTRYRWRDIHAIPAMAWSRMSSGRCK